MYEKKGSNMFILDVNNFLMVITIIFAFITFLISYNTREEFNETKIIPFIIIILALCVAVLITLYIGLFKSMKTRDYDQIILEEMNEMAARFTKEVYIKKNYNMKIGEEYAYIML